MVFQHTVTNVVLESINLILGQDASTMLIICWHNHHNSYYIVDFVMLYCANPTIQENTSKNYVDD